MVWGAVAGAAASAYSANQAAQAQGAANEYNVNIEEARMNEAARQFAEQQLDIQEARKYDADKYAYEQEAKTDRNVYAEGQLSPYTTAGTGALTKQQALLGLLGREQQQQAFDAYKASPGQEFLAKQQERATLRNMAATGGLRSGRAQTALQEQAFGRAQTDYGNYFNRLTGLSTMGRSAAGQLASEYQGVGTNVPTYDPRDIEYGDIAITRPEEKKSAGYNIAYNDPVGFVAGGLWGDKGRKEYASKNPISQFGGGK